MIGDFEDQMDDPGEFCDGEEHFSLGIGLDSGDFGEWEDAAPLADYIGEPDGDGHIAQTTSITCAVVSQQMILNDFGVLSPDTGQPLSEAELTYVAAVNGWLYEGTSPDDVGQLLDYYGVSNHHGYGLDNLVDELRQGHKVIVGVDSDELWNADNKLYNEMKDYLSGERANHAIVVKGIIDEGQGEPIVVVNDPGKPDGAGNQYPLSVFLDAFQDGDCHYVATDNVPPMLANHSAFGGDYNPDAGVYAKTDLWGHSSEQDTASAANEAGRFNTASLKIDGLERNQRIQLLQNL